MSASDPITLRFRVADLPAKKPTRIRLDASADARAALARDLGILGVDALTFTGELRPVGRHDWELDGKFSARVVQACVVTLDPVVTDIGEPVLRRYLSDMPEPEGDEVEMPEDDSMERLGPEIDVGAAVTEALALALPLYPRSSGADAALPEPEAVEKPFAALADLLRKSSEDPGT